MDDNKRMQITLTWAQFRQLMALACSDPDDTDAMQELQALLQPILQDKLDAMIRRDLYSRGLAGDDAARQEYLDQIGMHKDFRR